MIPIQANADQTSNEFFLRKRGVDPQGLIPRFFISGRNLTKLKQRTDINALISSIVVMLDFCQSNLNDRYLVRYL